VKETAKKGKGSYYLVEDNENLKPKVIKALAKAMSPSLTGCKITSNIQKPIVASSDGELGEVFRNQLINHLFIISQH